MKKLIAFLLAAAMTLSLAACAGPAAPSDDDGSAADAEMKLLQPGRLIVATEGTYPPYEMPAGDGEDVAGTGLRGIDIELAAALAEKLGLELVVNDVPFDEALYSAQNGKADLVLAGLDVTQAREKYMRFSRPYAEAVQVVVVCDGSDIQEAADLKDKQLGVVQGTGGFIFCTDDFGEENVTVFDDYAALIRSLRDGSVDAAVLDKAPAEEIVRGDDTLTILKKAYSEESYAIGIAEDNPGLQAAVDAALSQLEADGTLQAIIERYIPSKPM